MDADAMADRTADDVPTRRSLGVHSRNCLEVIPSDH